VTRGAAVRTVLAAASTHHSRCCQRQADLVAEGGGRVEPLGHHEGDEVGRPSRPGWREGRSRADRSFERETGQGPSVEGPAGGRRWRRRRRRPTDRAGPRSRRGGRLGRSSLLSVCATAVDGRGGAGGARAPGAGGGRAGSVWFAVIGCFLAGTSRNVQYRTTKPAVDDPASGPSSRRRSDRLPAPVLPPARLYVDGRWRDTESSDDLPNPATGDGSAGPVGSARRRRRRIAAARGPSTTGPGPRLTREGTVGPARRLPRQPGRRAADLVALVVAEAGSTVPARLSHQVSLPLRASRWWVGPRRRTVRTRCRPGSRAGPTAPPGSAATSCATLRLAWWRHHAVQLPVLPQRLKVGPRWPPATPSSSTLAVHSVLALVLAEGGRSADRLPGASRRHRGPEVARCSPPTRRSTMVTFTGPNVVGAAIMGQASPTLKRCCWSSAASRP